MFRKLRLYKNNDFAFNEVINERTFIDNAKVVKEVVNLLENYRIKYSSKNQFLGDFFEKLLNISVTQESGQFFTPIPIANFIINSIPVENIIKEKIEKSEDNFLPYVIDYACGSGHFLTESMHRIDKVLKNVETGLKTIPQKKNFSNWKNEYLWAKEFIYGIEFDYRLAKTTKVACYLNGDGEANICYANGLDSFNSENYKKYNKLQKPCNFDFVVANPPYSVKMFLKNIKNYRKDFIISNTLSDNSDDIELLFIERTFQLLKENGFCGIIVPDTILVNEGKVYSQTREFILENFRIVGLTLLGEQTFIKTGQSTVVLFMQKRSTVEKKKTYGIAKECFDKFIKEYPNTKALEDFFKNVYDNEIPESYFKNLCENPEKEIRKYYLFLLNQQQVVLVTTGKKKKETLFLGYKHTDKRNYEGIKPFPDNDENKIISKLFNEDNIFDKSKVSFYIYQSFCGQQVSENDILNANLSENLWSLPLSSIIDFSKFLILTKKRMPLRFDTSLFVSTSLDSISKKQIDNGEVAPQPRYFENKNKLEIFIRAKHLNGISKNKVIIESDCYFELDKVRKKFKEGTIVFPKSGQSVNTNNIAMIPNDCYVVNHLATIYIEDIIIRKYVFYILKHYKTSNFKLIDTGYPTIKLSSIRNAFIPLPKEEALLITIVNELEEIDRESFSEANIFKKEKEILTKHSLIYI